jgi:hypothetical protein
MEMNELTRLTAALEAVALELARTGEDPLGPEEAAECLIHLAEVCEQYPEASAHDLACYLMYPQF